MNVRARDLMRQRMEQKHISQVELAERLSMTSSQVSRILSGDRDTTLENMLAIADALGIERSYLLRLASGLSPEPKEDAWVNEWRIN